MKIYTKTGDDGTTGLFGTSGPQGRPRVDVYGTIDEANTILGVALAAGAPEDGHVLLDLQARLFDLGADLATPRDGRPIRPTSPASTTRTWRCSKLIDRFEALPPLTISFCPRAFRRRRTSSRADRRPARGARWSRARAENLGPALPLFVNRLSDLLFVLARWTNHAARVADVPWKPRADEPED